MAKHKKQVWLIFTYGLLLSLLGCATVKEGVWSITGISIKELESDRKSAILKTFSGDYFSCYTKTLDSLKKMGAYVYAEDVKKKMIAIYVSQDDTTPVGFFFKEIDQSNTQIEVSSPSAYAKQYFADKLATFFNKVEETKKTTEQK